MNVVAAPYCECINACKRLNNYKVNIFYQSMITWVGDGCSISEDVSGIFA